MTRELTLSEIAARTANVDLILTEGFKRESAPKIEVSRQALAADLVTRAEELVAVVSDHLISLAVPRFDLGDTRGLADCVERRFLT